MASATLNAKARHESGKGVARKLRQAGDIPAVIYGHGRAPQALSISNFDLERLLGSISVSSTVIELTLDGNTSRTLIREIQRHPYRKQILHVDFQELVAGEKVTVRIPIRYNGTAEGVKAGGILEEVMHELEIRVDPSNMPNHIDIDVTPLTIGHGVHVEDLRLPEGVEAMADAEATVCVVVAPRAVVEETPVVAGVEGAEPEAAAEPELIRKPKAAEEEGEE